MTLQALFYVEQNYCYAILRPLQREILRRGGQVRWFLVGDEVDASYLREDEQRLMDVPAVKNWVPDVVFVPGNVVPKFIPGLKVEVFHGFNAGKINSRGREDHFEIRNCFDLYCTQGPSTTEPFLQLKQKHGFFDVVETGWPMVDPLFEEASDGCYRVSDNRKTVLFCSTFSRKYSCAETLFHKIAELKGSGRFRWLVQFHPKMPEDTVAKYKTLECENLRFVETDNVVPLLQAADVMLCDTSSILLMFLLLRKPVVTFCNQSPGDHIIDITSAENIDAALDSAVHRPPELMESIERFCQQMHPYSDGKSSVRVLDAVENILANGTGSLRRKPLNLLREFKMRKQLNYWRG